MHIKPFRLQKIKDLSKVSLEREAIPVHMSTLWPQILSKNFYKGSKTPLGLPQSSGSLSAGVFRQHTYHGSNPRAMSGAYPADMAVVDRFGFSGKPEEVSVKSQTADRIPGVPREFHRNETVFNGRKTVKIKTRSRVPAEISPSSKDVGKLLGLLPVNSSSHCSGPSSFQEITGRYDTSHKRLPECSHLSPEAKKELEWWRDHFKMNNGRSILPLEEQETIFTDASKQGWGAHLNLEKIGGRWIWEEKVDTHINILELKAAFFALQAFLPQLKQQHIQFGIENKTVVAYINKLGGTRSHHLDISSLSDVEFCRRQKTNLASSVCSQRGKSHCRQKVKGVSGQPGMDAASSSVSGIAKRSWLFRKRSLCNTCEPSGSCVCQLETRAWGSCHRCFQCKMGCSSGLSVSSFLYDRKMSQKDLPGSVTLCSDHTSVEKQTVVSSHSVSLGRATIASSKMTGSSKTFRHQKDTPPVSSKKLQDGCMAHFRETLTKKIFSESLRYPSLLLEKENCQSV